MAIVVINCKNCKKNFDAKSKKACFCSPECRKEFNIRENGEIGKDFVICQICKRAVASVTGIHMKTYHPDYTAEKYKDEFSGFSTIPLSVSEKRTIGAKKAGARMREPEHRKRLSESFKGENNPMHSSNTTKEFRLSISPFSPQFYKKKFPDLSEAECVKLAKNKSDSVEKKSWTQISYWKERGFSEEEAKKKISSVQKTFSLDICIQKYGEIEGRKRWVERQEKWIKNYKKTNYSKKSQELFKKIYELICGDYEEINFATLKCKKTYKDESDNKNYEKVLRLPGCVIVPDFFIYDTKKVIEFDGVYWHDFKRRNMPENKLREQERERKLIENGYDILRINEVEWDNSPEETVEKCLRFINGNI